MFQSRHYFKGTFLIFLPVIFFSNCFMMPMCMMHH